MRKRGDVSTPARGEIQIPMLHFAPAATPATDDAPYVLDKPLRGCGCPELLKTALVVAIEPLTCGATAALIFSSHSELQIGLPNKRVWVHLDGPLLGPSRAQALQPRNIPTNNT